MRWWVCIGVALAACNDGESTDDAVEDAEMRDVLAPDLGVPATCLEVCSTYRQHCGEALLLEACDDCTVLVEGAAGDDHPQTYERAVALCRQAEAQEACAGLAGCLSDDDGLTGVATDVQVSVTGSAFDVAFDLADDAAWAVLGSKGSGRPSDLRVFFTVDGTFYRLEVDDLGVDAADSPLDAGRNPVTLDSVSDSLMLDVGQITVADLVTDGPLEVTATVAPTDRPDDSVTVEVRGVWAGQF